MTAIWALEDDFALLKAAVGEAARLVGRYYEREIKVRSKSGGSPVTEADEAADSLLRDRLTRARPTYGWLSEESEDNAERLNAKRVWIVDPIDGTRAFIRGLPHFTVCGALVEDHDPLLAVVINPASGEVFTAQRGNGAFRDGCRLHVTMRKNLDGARFVGPRTLFQDPRWPEPWPCMEIDNPNSVAYRLCLVAAGDRDGCLRLNFCHEWDLAAAHLIAEEAGAVVRSHRGEKLIYNKPRPTLRSVIAAGPELYQEILRRTQLIDMPGRD